LVRAGARAADFLVGAFGAAPGAARGGDFLAAFPAAFFKAVLAGLCAVTFLGAAGLEAGRGAGRFAADFFTAGGFFAPALRADPRVAVFFRFIMAGYLLVGSRMERRDDPPARFVCQGGGSRIAGADGMD
jgi:hypothetical protein